MISVNTPQGLSNKAVYYRILSKIFWSLVFSIPFMLLGHWSEAYRIVLVLYVIPVVIYSFLFKSTFSYIVSDKTISINSGVIFKKSNNIPLDAIRNVELTSNPLSGICRVKIMKIWTSALNQMVVNEHGTTHIPSGQIVLPSNDADELSTILKK